MAHITWSKSVTSPASYQTIWADGATLTLSVAEDRVTATLRLDSNQSGGPSSGAYARLWCGNESVMMNFQVDSLSYEFTVTSESGTVTATIFPAASWSLAPGEENPIISESYSGARMNSAPQVSVSIPEAVSAGSSVPVTCTMSDRDGDALSGTLFRFYQAAGTNHYTQEIISQNLRQTTIYHDNIPGTWGGGKIYYALNVSDGKVTSSAATFVRTIAANHAPTVPAYLNIPSNIGGDSSIEIDWGESTDEDGNLAGYVLERSTDMGASWSEVYKGGELETVNHIPPGTQTVRYRVKAYDTYNAESGYRNAPSSGDISVSNNRAPTTPAAPITISPSALTTGISAVISWGESSDPDGDSFDYVLERSVNGLTSYEPIYTGTDRSATDTVGSWETVSYRVKAMDVHGASSGYLTAETKVVAWNRVPTITVKSGTTELSDNAELGTKTGVFSLTWQVGDADPSDTLTVKEIVDGAVKKTVTGAARSTEYTFNFRTGSAASTDYWRTLLNGEHTVRFEVSDGRAAASLTVTFVKLTDVCTITLTENIAAETGMYPALAAVSISGYIPADVLADSTKFSVEVTADGGTNWEQCAIFAADAPTVYGRKKGTAGNVNAELKGGHYLFLHKFTHAGQLFNWRINASTASSEDTKTAHIDSVQWAFTETDDASKVGTAAVAFNGGSTFPNAGIGA